MQFDWLWNISQLIEIAPFPRFPSPGSMGENKFDRLVETLREQPENKTKWRKVGNKLKARESVLWMFQGCFWRAFWMKFNDSHRYIVTFSMD